MTGRPFDNLAIQTRHTRRGLPMGARAVIFCAQPERRWSTSESAANSEQRHANQPMDAEAIAAARRIARTISEEIRNVYADQSDESRAYPDLYANSRYREDVLTLAAAVLAVAE